MTGSQGLSHWMDRLPEDLRREVKGKMIKREISSGETIYRAGDPGDEVYHILSGTVRIYTLTDDGRELLYDLFPPGTSFGESSLIDDRPRPHMTEAVGPVTLGVLSRAAFFELWRSHPEFSHAIAWILSQRSRRLYEIYEGVSLAALSRRMAGRLCSLARTTGQEREGVVHFDMRITQEDIGSLCAGSRQSVNKILKQWQLEGMIDVAYGSLVINKLPALQRLGQNSEFG
jgi:CRP/FNR family cyclic AMP-dependent transcriptional regulator